MFDVVWAGRCVADDHNSPCRRLSLVMFPAFCDDPTRVQVGFQGFGQVFWEFHGLVPMSCEWTYYTQALRCKSTKFSDYLMYALLQAYCKERTDEVRPDERRQGEDGSNS